jgi:hypothetical protein
VPSVSTITVTVGEYPGREEAAGVRRRSDASAEDRARAGRIYFIGKPFLSYKNGWYHYIGNFKRKQYIRCEQEKKTENLQAQYFGKDCSLC